MGKTSTFSLIRLQYIIFMIAISLAAAFGLAFVTNADSYTLINIIIYAIVMCILVVLWLEYERIKSDYSEEKKNNFKRIALFFLLYNLLIVGCGTFKLKLIPIAIAAASFALIAGSVTGIMFGMYFSVIYSLALGLDIAYLVLYLVTCVLLSLVAERLTKKDTGIQAIIIIIAACILCYSGAVFNVYQVITINDVLAIAINIIIIIFVGLLVGKITSSHFNNIQAVAVKKILDENSEVFQAFEERFPDKCEMVKLASMLSVAGACACGADINLVRAGALYSKIGLLDGEKLSVTNVAVGERYAFPSNLIKLLFEIENKSSIPSSKEAAIVLLAIQSANGVIALDRSNGDFLWNQEAVVHQVFNELSSAGKLENSGITMKAYLDIKNAFIIGLKKEKEKYDTLS